VKVRCETLVDATGRRHDQTLTLGKTYAVHTLSFGHDAEVRVLTDIGGYALGMYPMEMFTVVDGSIPVGWALGIGSGGNIAIAPAAWVRTLVEVGYIEDGVEGLSAGDIKAEIDRAEQGLNDALTADEIGTLANSLNEVLGGPDAIEDWEFETRIGVERSRARSLLRRLHKLAHVTLPDAD
jgi:hypothetical protein